MPHYELSSKRRSRHNSLPMELKPQKNNSQKTAVTFESLLESQVFTIGLATIRTKTGRLVMAAVNGTVRSDLATAIFPVTVTVPNQDILVVARNLEYQDTYYKSDPTGEAMAVYEAVYAKVQSYAEVILADGGTPPLG